MKLTNYFIAIFALMFSGLGAATDGNIHVSEVKMPKVPPVSRTAAIYLTIENKGNQVVELVGASTEAAGHTMIHQTVHENGVAKMRHVDTLPIQPQGILELKSGSYHVMLMGLNKEVISKPFKLSLEFAKHESVVVSVTPE